MAISHVGETKSPDLGAVSFAYHLLGSESRRGLVPFMFGS